MKTKPIIIAFCGPKQTGKTTACRAIRSKTPVEVVSFAAPLKEFAAQLFGKEYMNDKKEVACPTTGCSYRDWAIATGDAWRALNKDIFVDILSAEIKAINQWAEDQEIDCPLVLIDDLRYANEARRVKAEGGIIIQLHRDGVEYEMSHATEKPLDPKFVDHSCHVDKAVDFVLRLVKEICVAEVER